MTNLALPETMASFYGLRPDLEIDPPGRCYRPRYLNIRRLDICGRFGAARRGSRAT
jgi:hypothetical protein